jgi:hypothetical protein
VAPRDGVHGHEAEIVPVAGMIRAGIAEPDEQKHGSLD